MTLYCLKEFESVLEWNHNLSLRPFTRIALHSPHFIYLKNGSQRQADVFIPPPHPSELYSSNISLANFHPVEQNDNYAFMSCQVKMPLKSVKWVP